MRSRWYNLKAHETCEIAIRYIDRGARTVLHRGVWKLGGRADDPEVAAAVEEQAARRHEKDTATT